jgi:inorganic pyrophosphatase
MQVHRVLGPAMFLCVVTAQARDEASYVLPAAAASALARSLEASKTHATHIWRDTVPFNADGTVNAYVEIARGDRRKWEFDMRANARAIDRVIPPSVGGYPVNYGYVPQTVSYDGDPFDALVLGPPIGGGEVVRGVVVGLMFMDDEKGSDAKVVLSRVRSDGHPSHELTRGLRQEIGDYFRRYKHHEVGKFSTVPGWGTVADGMTYIQTTHAFFHQCRPPVRRAISDDGHRAVAPATTESPAAAPRLSPASLRPRRCFLCSGTGQLQEGSSRRTAPRSAISFADRPPDSRM